MVRFILSVLLLGSFLANAYFLALFFLIWSLAVYGGFEIVIVGMLLDGYFGAYTEVPWYTIGALLLWSIAVAGRQLLIVYDREYASFS